MFEMLESSSLLSVDERKPGEDLTAKTNLSALRNRLVYFLGTCLQASLYLPEVVLHATEIPQLHNLASLCKKKTKQSAPTNLYLVGPHLTALSEP